MVVVGAILAAVLVTGLALAATRSKGGTITSPLPTMNKILSSASKQQQQVKVAIVKDASTKASKAFSPNPIQIQPGTTVVWTNGDSTPHTVTSGKGMNDAAKGKVFDSGPIAVGKSYSHKFDAAGTFDYFCTLHPTMVGTVTVK